MANYEQQSYQQPPPLNRARSSSAADRYMPDQYRAQTQQPPVTQGYPNSYSAQQTPSRPQMIAPMNAGSYGSQPGSYSGAQPSSYNGRQSSSYNSQPGSYFPQQQPQGFYDPPQGSHGTPPPMPPQNTLHPDSAAYPPYPMSAGDMYMMRPPVDLGARRESYESHRSRHSHSSDRSSSCDDPVCRHRSGERHHHHHHHHKHSGSGSAAKRREAIERQPTFGDTVYAVAGSLKEGLQDVFGFVSHKY